jgi:hypothetical protein
MRSDDAKSRKSLVASEGTEMQQLLAKYEPGTDLRKATGATPCSHSEVVITPDFLSGVSGSNPLGSTMHL